MRLLLDTHAFLWFVLGDPKLPSVARSAIEDTSNDVSVSLASVWEMTIKHGLGKLPLDRPLQEFIEHQTVSNSIDVTPVRLDHIFRLLELSADHRDPFDRMIAAQCLVDGFVLVSADPAFGLFGTQRLWS